MSDTEVITEKSGTDRDPKVLVLIATGALVVAALLWFLVVSPLLGGDDDGDELAAPVASGAAQAAQADTTAQDAAEVPDTLPVETYEVYLSRDPFSPVVPRPAPASEETGGDGDTPTGGGSSVGGGGTTGGGTTGGGTTGGGTTGGGTTGGGTTGGGTATPTPTPTVEPVAHNAVLVDVFTDENGEPRALVRVDETVYTLGEGDPFADAYVAVAIAGTCADFTYESKPFTLCEGGAPPAGYTPTSVDRDGREVLLVDVYREAGTVRAVVQVESRQYDVEKNDSFAQNFRAMALDEPCATLLYGDEAFTLCEGDRVLK